MPPAANPQACGLILRNLFRVNPSVPLLTQRTQSLGRSKHRGTRIITYRRSGQDKTIYFTGRIIAISNLELHPGGIIDALKSRVHCLKYAPTDDQIAALMNEIAIGGWHHISFRMSPRECQ